MSELDHTTDRHNRSNTVELTREALLYISNIMGSREMASGKGTWKGPLGDGVLRPPGMPAMMQCAMPPRMPPDRPQSLLTCKAGLPKRGRSGGEAGPSGGEPLGDGVYRPPGMPRAGPEKARPRMPPPRGSIACSIPRTPPPLPPRPLAPEILRGVWQDPVQEEAEEEVGEVEEEVEEDVEEEVEEMPEEVEVEEEGEEVEEVEEVEVARPSNPGHTTLNYKCTTTYSTFQNNHWTTKKESEMTDAERKVWAEIDEDYNQEDGDAHLHRRWKIRRENEKKLAIDIGTTAKAKPGVAKQRRQRRNKLEGSAINGQVTFGGYGDGRVERVLTHEPSSSSSSSFRNKEREYFGTPWPLLPRHSGDCFKDAFKKLNDEGLTKVRVVESGASTMGSSRRFVLGANVRIHTCLHWALGKLIWAFAVVTTYGPRGVDLGSWGVDLGP